jgi:hypothetical protein
MAADQEGGMIPDPNGWRPVTPGSPEDSSAVLVCWGNCAIMIAHRCGGKWFASVQKEGPEGTAMNLELDGAPSHWQWPPGSPQVTWDGRLDAAGWHTRLAGFMPASAMAERDRWRAIAFELARHLRNTDGMPLPNTDGMPLPTWAVGAADLLNRTRALDAEGYDKIVKGGPDRTASLFPSA